MGRIAGQGGFMSKALCCNKNTQDKTFCQTVIAFVGVLICGVMMICLLPEIVMAGPDQETFPVENFDNGKARFYKYKGKNGHSIKYFIVKSDDGVIRAAFDACDVCWRAGKGYKQDGGVMICKNCGRRFPAYSINEVQGGCNPAPLPRIIVGDKLIIKHSNLEKGAAYFDF